MKRVLCLITVIAVLAGVCAACGDKRRTPSEEELEQDDSWLPGKEEGSSLEFWLTENVDDVDFSKYQRRYGLYGGWEYYGTGPAGDITRISLMYQPEGKLYNLEDKEVIGAICEQLHEISGTSRKMEEGVAGPFYFTLHQGGDDHVAAYELLSGFDIWEETGSGMLIHSDTEIPLYAYLTELITRMEPVKGIECFGRLD
ncbi:MAG: hypothetical protein K6F26_08540 [Lachnospiraceae bacterium]|nr:hypothetical protein [Lachnospiraceae bacterium]